MSEFTNSLTLKNAKLNIDEKLIKLRDGYRENGVPTILTDGLNELMLFVAAKKPEKILELGTATGCSGIAMLEACETSNLTTVEKLEESFIQAKKNFAEFGMEKRVVQYLGDAEEVVNELEGKFDFVFLDCNKSKYKVLLPKLKELLKKGGILFADNVLFRGYISGEVPAPHKYHSIKNNMRLFLDMITEDKDFITTVLDIGDGVSVSLKK